MTNQERIAVVQELGYTERQASFLVLAALHGGYFLRRQFAAFLGRETGRSTDCLIEKATGKGHVREHESANRTIVYHVAGRPFFDLIGEEDNRNRRWRQPYSVVVKLMGLDYVLAHPEHRYLSTETEKLDYFVRELNLDQLSLPARIYHSKDGREKTTRYFVDKFPIFLSEAPGASCPVVSFCYVDGSMEGPSGFGTYLSQYEELFARLESFRVIFVAANGAMFAKAESIFSRSCGRSLGYAGRTQDPDKQRLAEHFRDRQLFERRETVSFDKRRLDRLREELREFGGTRYDALYRQWLEQGDSAVLGAGSDRKSIQASFSPYLLRYEYSLFDSLRTAVPA